MNIDTLALYVNLDVDDSFTEEEIAQWYNKGVANYNLIPPLTTYNIIDTESTDDLEFDDTFLLGIMLPFINSAIRGQDASVQEKQLYLQEFMMNARQYKTAFNVPFEKLLDQKNSDLGVYQLGENVYVSDMTRTPFAGDWSSVRNYTEVASTITVIFKDLDDDLAVTYGSAAYGSALSAFVTDAGLTGENFYKDLSATNAYATTDVIVQDTVIYHSGS